MTTPPSSGDFYQEKGWQLVWSDEFDATVIDRDKWAFEENCWGGGNNELQCYVDKSENAFVQDGMLHIRAIKGDYTGAVYNADSPDYDANDTKTQSWTSSRLRSVAPMPFVDGQDPTFNFRNDWTYGRFEIRAKLPSGQGTWPAVWMLPTDWEFGGWASSGEIDIMEAVNLKADRVVTVNGVETVVPENRVHGTLHYGRNWPNNVYSGVEYDFGDVSPADNFHTYAIEWEEGAIRWFIDGNHYATQTQEGWYTHYQDENGDWQTSGVTAAPFNKDFHLIMNVAIGGNWPAVVNEKGVNPDLQQVEMVIDYVRVYQCKDDATGVACASKAEEGSYTLEHGKVEPDLPVAAPPLSDVTLAILADSLGEGFSALITWDGGDGGDSVTVENGVASVVFTGNGNMSFKPDSITDMSSFADGELHFDLKVVSLGAATDIAVKMDSGWPNVAAINISTLEGGLPTVGGDFVSYTVPVQDFIDANVNFNIAAIVNAVVFESVGGGDLSIQIKSVSFTRPPETETTGPLTLFEDEANAKWVPWDCCGGSTPSVIEDSPEYGNVLKFEINWDTVVGFNSRTEFSPNGIPHNATDNTTLEFDLKMVKEATVGTVDWKLKVESATTAAEVDLSTSVEGHSPVLDTWQHYTFNIADLATKGLDITKIDVVMMFPAWGPGKGAQFLVDNVQFK